MSSYAGHDDCTDQILEFIAGGVPDNPSGEARGNYNAVIGNAGSTRDLSQLTLAEIYALQDDLHRREPSTAIGRYQFLKGTLQELQAEKGLGDDALFTPALQDQLAVSLLVRRGYSKWWNREIGNPEFLHELSLEWASLPDPERGGRSHYDGDGINSASTTAPRALQMLARARAAQQAPNLKPEPAPSAAGDSSGVLAWLHRELGI